LPTKPIGAALNNAPNPKSIKPIPLWMWAAIASVLLFAVYNFYEVQSTRETIRQTHTALDEQVRLQRETAQELVRARREALILTDPKSIKIAMPAGKAGLPELHATWHPALGVVISGEKLPVLSANRTLQLWLVPKAAGAQPLAVMTVSPDSDGKFHLLIENPPGVPSTTKALEITEEPEAGSPQPTTIPIWVGALAGKSSAR
jgi:hypothetical protein